MDKWEHLAALSKADRIVHELQANEAPQDVVLAVDLRDLLLMQAHYYGGATPYELQKATALDADDVARALAAHGGA